MAERITSEGVNVEYKDTTNNMRITAEGVEVEYKDTTNKMRITAIGVMVEYQQNAAPPSGRVQGPPAQMMG